MFELFKKIKWWKLLVGAVFIFICVAWYFIAANDMRFSDEEVSDYFNEKVIEYEINRIQHEGGEIRYISSGLTSDIAETIIIFIHGAPGASDSFYSYLSDTNLMNKAHLVALDRLGYGYSSYGTPVTNIVDQASAVKSLINAVQSKKVILVSHSYGCAVSGVLSAQESDIVLANIMLCPVIDPEEEKVFFFSSWPSLPIVKNLFSGAMQVSSFEKMSHADELKFIEPLWLDTRVPTFLYHGQKDWIAPVANAYYLNDKIDSEYLTVEVDENASHFIIWEQQDKIVQKILEFL